MSSTAEWQLVLPWEPWAKMRPRISKAIKGRPPRTHQPKEDREAEDRTREFLRANYPGPLLGTNIRLSAFFFRASRQVVDLDNLLKHFEDAATGICWVNDCQVTAYGPTELHLDKGAPRTHIWIEPHTDATLLRDYNPLTGRTQK